MTLAEANASFQTPLDIRELPGDEWEILSEFVYVSPRMTVRIPVGFQTDFASIPRFFWRVIAPTDDIIGKAAVVHDFLYRTPAFLLTRQEADAELREAMTSLGASQFKRNLTYWAVRMGGGHAFKPRSVRE
jgi:hypothetical protein